MEQLAGTLLELAWQRSSQWPSSQLTHGICGICAVAASICPMSLSFMQTTASIWMDPVKTSPSLNSPEFKNVSVILLDLTAIFFFFSVGLVPEWSKQEKLVVFHVEPGNVLSLALIIALRLASWVSFYVRFKGQSRAQQFACVIFIGINDANQVLHNDSSTHRNRRAGPTYRCM